MFSNVLCMLFTPDAFSCLFRPGSIFNAGLDRLSSAIEAGEALQARMRESLQMRSPLEDLQALADQAAQLPVYVSDVDTVQALLGKAQDWLRKANTLAAQVRCLSLEQFNDLGMSIVDTSEWLQSVVAAVTWQGMCTKDRLVIITNGCNLLFCLLTAAT